jgi:hypothetical protein
LSFLSNKLDIELNEKLILKERFNWNLAEENVSPAEFIDEFVAALKLPEINRDKLTDQLLT